MRNYPSVPNVFRVVSSHSVNNEASLVQGGGGLGAKTSAVNMPAGTRNAAVHDVNVNIETISLQQQEQVQQQKRTQPFSANVNKRVAATATTIGAATTTNGVNSFERSNHNEQFQLQKQIQQQDRQQKQQQHLFQLKTSQGISSSISGGNTIAQASSVGVGTTYFNDNEVVNNKFTTTASIERQSYQQNQQPHSPYATLPRAISVTGNGDFRHNGGSNRNARAVADVINTISGSIPATGFDNGSTASIGNDSNLNLDFGSILSNSCTDLGKSNGVINARVRSGEECNSTRISKDTEGLDCASSRIRQSHPCNRIPCYKSNSNGYLWMLTPVAASISVAIVISALAGPQWLFTEEKLPNSLYNGTANFNALDDGAYITKYTKSSLWILCTTLQGIEKYNCIKIDYFSLDGYQPDPNDSTSAIPYTVTKSCPFFLASGIALLISFIVYLIPTCSHQNSLYYFTAGIMFIVSGLLMLIGLIAYISILKSEIGSKLRARSTLQPPLFKVNYGQSFFLFVFGFVATEFVGLLNIFLYISLQEVSYYSRLPCFTLSNIREKIKEGRNPHSQTYKTTLKHTEDQKPLQRMRANGTHRQVHNVRISLPREMPSNGKPKKPSIKNCHRHLNARDANNFDLNRRYYFKDVPSVKCNLHSRNLAKSLNELYTESERMAVAGLPPPPPGRTLLPNIAPHYSDLSQEFPLTRSVSTATEIFQNESNGNGKDGCIGGSRGQTPSLERKTHRNMATNTRPSDPDLLRNKLNMRQLAANRRQRFHLDNNHHDDNVIVIDNDEDNTEHDDNMQNNCDDQADDDEIPQRLCGLKCGIRKTKDELFQEFCKRAGMRPKPKNIYYIASEEELLRLKHQIVDLGAANKTSGLKPVPDEIELDEEDDGFKQNNQRIYSFENDTHSPLPSIEPRNTRRASMFTEPAQLRRLNSNLSLHAFYPPEPSASYQKGFSNPTKSNAAIEIWPTYPAPLRYAFGGSQSHLDATMQLQQNRSSLPRSFPKNTTDSQDSVASASLQALNNAYSSSQTRLTSLMMQQQQQQQDHLLSLSRNTNAYLHKSYDDLKATNYGTEPAYSRQSPSRMPEISEKPNTSHLLQQPIIHWPVAIPSSPSNFPGNYQIYGPAVSVHSPLPHTLVTRSVSNGSATSSNGHSKFQRSFAFDEHRRPSAISETFGMDEFQLERRRSHASLFNGSLLIGGQNFVGNNNAKIAEGHYDIVNGTAV